MSESCQYFGFNAVKGLTKMIADHRLLRSTVLGIVFATFLPYHWRYAMFSQTTNQATSEEFETLAETLADYLVSGGDRAGANQVLSVVSRQANTPSIALRRAEHHLNNQDPSSALAALIPVWEAGDQDPEVESLMGITSLILGLDDVVDNLTASSEGNLHLGALRWVLSCCDSAIETSLDLSDANVQWMLLRLCRTFAEQGRTDIVGAVWSRLEAENCATLLNRLAAIPRTTWILATPARPRLDLRDSITHSAKLPAVNAVYNWIWASARDVFRGERILLLGNGAGCFAPLFEHAEVQLCEPNADLGIEQLLQTYPSGSFDHVVCIYGFEAAFSQRDVSQLLWRSLRHGGQLHLVSTTHHNAGYFDAYLKPERIVSLLETTGFDLRGHQLRDGEGVPVEEERARALVLRAQKNLV